MIHNCVNCPVAWKNFKNLTEAELSFVNENRCEASFKAGEIILKQGSPASNAVFLASGMAKISYEGTDQQNLIVDIALPQRLILTPGVDRPLYNLYTVTAITPVQTCFINLAVLYQIAGENAEFASGMLMDLSAKSYFLHQKLITLAQKNMLGRLAETILFFSREVYQSDSFNMVLTRQELGEMTHMARESVVRTLQQLENSGVIRILNSNIQILDPEKLKSIAGKD